MSAFSSYHSKQVYKLSLIPCETIHPGDNKVYQGVIITNGERKSLVKLSTGILIWVDNSTINIKRCQNE